MAKITKEICLDLNAFTPPIFVKAKQGDDKSRFLKISFKNNGAEIILPIRTAAKISVRKPDGKQVLNSGTITGNVAEFELTAQILKCAGIAQCEVRLYEGMELLSSAIFYLNIHPTAFDESMMESTNEYKALTDAFDQAQSMKIHMANTSIHVTAQEKAWIAKIPGLEGGGGAPKEHTHKTVDITDLQGKLDAKANSTHSHAITAITNLRAELDAKASREEVAVSYDAYLSLKAFGAKGDGITDDTAVFKSAVAAAVTAGRVLYIDTGVYIISSRIILDNPIVIMGSGNTEAVIKFVGGAPAVESPYHAVNYEESHAVFSIRCNNVTLWNFAIKGGPDKTHCSAWNGITFHYPKKKENGDSFYASAERCNLQQLNISCFKNGVFVYGGWNRYILTCHFIDCSVAGMQYKALEVATVGNWSSSGDILQSCQFIGNLTGYKADRNFEATVQNCVFEYNVCPIWTYGCKDMFFVNCWNEANEQNLSITGSAKFSGGYNIIPETVTHVNNNGKGIVEFESDTDRIIKQGDETIFLQTGGIITMGVSLGSQRINEILNPGFGTIAVPGFEKWLVEAQSLTSVETTNQLNEVNSAIINCDPSQGWDSSPNYGIKSSKISIDPTQNYLFDVAIKTNKTSNISQGFFVEFLLYKNENVLGWVSSTNITPIANNVWENHSVTFNSTNCGYIDSTHVEVKIYVKQFGKMWISSPFFGAESVTSDTAGIKLSVDPDLLEAVNYVGSNVGQIAKKSYVDKKFAELRTLIAKA